MEEKVEKRDYECRQRNRLAIQNVFLPRENILFLKEWLVYHMELGVEHFYLYDNTGSVGRNGSNNKVNKYGIPFADITSGLSDKDIQDIMDEISRELSGRVTYVKWTPRDERGNIIYGWNEALIHYILNYGNESDWTCFIDMDEFLFSVKDINIKDHLRRLESDGYTSLLIHQKKFDERYYNLDRFVTKIEKCVEGINTTGWASKLIIKTDMVDTVRLSEKKKGWNMHMIPVKSGKGAWANMDELRFNHYNTNEKLLKWIQGFYKSSEKICLNGRDDSMKRHWSAIESKCATNSAMDILKRYPSATS